MRDRCGSVVLLFSAITKRNSLVVSIDLGVEIVTVKTNMCGDCIKSKCPDRGTTCLDNGSYILNFDQCSECRKKEPIKIAQRNVEVKDDGEEVISYEHKCTYCGHVIAEHEHTFIISGDYQEYGMYCMLCGVGSDSISIQPVDPRKELELF